MRIESALWASKEGLNAHGQAISVIGDNISNSNTTGFKGSRIEFKDILSDGGNAGGQMSIGTGAQVSAVRPIFTSGEVEFTGRPLDVAITGNGFFLTGDAADPNFTRSGVFSVDEAGILVDQANNPILGYQGDATTLSSIDIRKVSASGAASSAIGIVGNLDSTAIAGTAPNNPATFREIGTIANLVQPLEAYDSLGNTHTISLAFTKTGTNTWTAQAYIDGGEVGGTVGQPVSLGQTTITFNDQGQIPDANKATTQIAAAPAYSNGAAAGNFTINFGDFTQYGTSNQIKSVTNDGKSSGNISSYEFARDGTIYAILDNGTTSKVGSIQLGDVPNKDGLYRTGKALFKATETAGDITTGSPGSGGLGTIQGGSLERSNVDLADQFVDLVLYQRGYQAASQTLNVAGQLIRDTIGLMR